MTDRRSSANPNAVLEVDPYARAVRLPWSDLVRGARTLNHDAERYLDQVKNTLHVSLRDRRRDLAT